MTTTPLRANHDEGLKPFEVDLAEISMSTVCEGYRLRECHIRI